jgi:hypothetical protein
VLNIYYGENFYNITINNCILYVSRTKFTTTPVINRKWCESKPTPPEQEVLKCASTMNWSQFLASRPVLLSRYTGAHLYLVIQHPNPTLLIVFFPKMIYAK